ncbi:hypothetical protein GCM10027419_43740 [Pandoraea terrae]
MPHGDCVTHTGNAPYTGAAGIDPRLIELVSLAQALLQSHEAHCAVHAKAQLDAIRAMLQANEAKGMLSILAPRDLQYARVAEKRRRLSEHASQAEAEADRTYSMIRCGGPDKVIHLLAGMELTPPVAASFESEKSGARERFMMERRRCFVWNRHKTHGSKTKRRSGRCVVCKGAKMGAVGNEVPMVERADSESDRTAQTIWDAVVAGATLKDVHGVSEDLMQGLYAHAYDFYDKGRLDQAEAFFRFLCIYDFYNQDYLIGLGAVFQLKQQFRKAIDLYAVAFALGKSDYRPVFYAGQCHLSMQNEEEARECFALVEERSCDADLRTKSRTYLAVLEAPQNSMPKNADQEVS